jgi:hypothetical protein
MDFQTKFLCWESLNSYICSVTSRIIIDDGTLEPHQWATGSRRRFGSIATAQLDASGDAQPAVRRSSAYLVDAYGAQVGRQST